MSVTEPSNGRSILDIFRRGQGWQEISGYHVGDIDTDQSIWVMTGSTLVGNVSAARVRVDGILFGKITAETTSVRPGGQVWGDVNTRSLEIEPGGKIHGWISTLGSAEAVPPSVRTVSQDGDLPLDEESESEDGEREGDETPHMAPRNQEEVNALKKLQLEAAAAIAARAELEQSFDQRLTDMASEANARANEFEEALTIANSELDSLRPELERLQSELSERDNHINQQAAELLVARSLLAERQKDFDLLQSQFDEQANTLSNVKSAREISESELESARAEIQVLTERKSNLESALQASLQHTAELDESLVRWQELANTMEARANDFEKEISNLKLRLEESATVTERMRNQRDQAKDAWEASAAELMALRNQANNPELEARVAELEEELDLRLAEVTKWRNGFEELAKRLRAYDKQRGGDQSAIVQELQQVKVRLASRENELNQYWQQSEQQGRRLAELQSEIVERDIQLQDARQTASKQAQLIKQIKQLSTQQIRKLERDLANSRERIAALESQLGTKS